MSDWRIVIPARIGSQGIKGKNVAILGGKPLICHAIDAALATGADVAVFSNDPEVSAVVSRYGDRLARFIRPEHFDAPDITIDELSRWVATELHVADPSLAEAVKHPHLMILQPTNALLTAAHLTEAMTTAAAFKHKVPLTIVGHAHGLYWQDGAPLQTRVNRQDQTNPIEKEIGIRIFTRGVDPAAMYEPLYMAWADRIIDIDTTADLAMAQHKLQQGTIRFFPAAGKSIGWGHVTRCLTLARSLQHHRVFFTDAMLEPEAKELVSDWPTIDRDMSEPAVMVLDHLDSTEEDVAAYIVEGWKVVTLEDLGSGLRLAHATVNEMYRDRYTPHPRMFSGPSYVVLRPEFIGARREVKMPMEAQKALVTFGGTDPADMTTRIKRIEETGQLIPDLTILDPPSAGHMAHNMAELILAHDLVITSAGRTLYEAAALGVPAIAFPVNAREEGHLAIGIGNVRSPVLAQYMTDDDIAALINRVATNVDMLVELHNGGRVIDGMGTARTAAIIEAVLLDGTF